MQRSHAGACLGCIHIRFGIEKLTNNMVVTPKRRPVQCCGTSFIRLIHIRTRRQTLRYPLTIPKLGRLPNIGRLNATHEQPKD